MTPGAGDDHTPPRSDAYGDTYYSAEDGWAEAWHVFIGGNDLVRRFAALDAGEVFTIGELGYGTGLNVAAAMTAFAARGHDRGHLVVFSVEGHPLGPAALAEHTRSAGRRWADAAPALDALCRAYPLPRAGFAQTRPAAGVTLILAFGEAEAMLKAATIRADAWFLDGFSPAKNPAMWSEEVLASVAGSSAPQATAATFTVAGAVRRELTAAGFAVAKAPGFGRKREMLMARLPGDDRSKNTAGRIAILGGGIAGACAAWHLARLGQDVTIHDPGGLAHGASGNPGGLITPRVDAGAGTAAPFYRDAYAYALEFYGSAGRAAFDPCGASIRLDADRARKVLATGLWPEEWLRPDPVGLSAPGAGVLRPAEAINALCEKIEVRPDADWSRCEDAFRVGGIPYDQVVIAAPQAAATLDLGGDILSAKRGQIDVFAGPPPRGIASGDGYAAPLDAAILAGATYASTRLDDAVHPHEADTAANTSTAARLTGGAIGDAIESRAAIRAATPDRHPLCGPVPDLPTLRQTHGALRHGGQPVGPVASVPGLFVVSGLGSRGLMTAPLLGAHIAALLSGTTTPLRSDIAAFLSPARFALRMMKRKLL